MAYPIQNPDYAIYTLGADTNQVKVCHHCGAVVHQRVYADDGRVAHDKYCPALVEYRANLQYQIKEES